MSCRDTRREYLAWPCPDPARVEILCVEEHDSYTRKRFEFHNGVDMVVPGILVLPKNRRGPVPVIIGMHGHSGPKNDYRPSPYRSEVTSLRQKRFVKKLEIPRHFWGFMEYQPFPPLQATRDFK